MGNDNKYSLTFAFANFFCYRNQTICQNPKVTSEGHATFLLILSSLQTNGCPNCSSNISQKAGVTAFHFPGLSSWKIISFIDTNAPLLGRNSLSHRCYKDGIWYSFLFVFVLFLFFFWGGVCYSYRGCLLLKCLPGPGRKNTKIAVRLSVNWRKTALQEYFTGS